MPDFSPRINGKPINVKCTLEQAGDGTYSVKIECTGGQPANAEYRRPRPRGPELTAARRTIHKHLCDLSATITHEKIGRDSGDPVSVDNVPASEWKIPNPGSKSLTVWFRVPDDVKGQVLQVMQGNVARDDEGLPMSLSAFAVVEKLRTYRNLIVEGVAGTGKSHLIGYLKSEARFAGKPAIVRVVVFHPATSYEDFVEGLRPQDNKFLPRDGVLLELCREVAKSDQTWVLVIDEINRANTAKVLGDLLYAIESSKRVAASAARSILAATDTDPKDVADKPWTLLQLERPVPIGDGTFRQRFVVPDNLLILGTMNTTDRSVGTLDLALRRRFVVVRMQPMAPVPLKDALQKKHQEIAATLETDIDEWHQLNERLGDEIGPDALLGHSYFFDFAAAKARDDAAHDLNIWRDLLLPQLGEILVAFNAIDRIDALLGDLDTGGWTLKQIGSKVDGYPIVVERNT